MYIWTTSVRPTMITEASESVLTSRIIVGVDMVTIEGIAIPRAYTRVLV